jgi:hypothetical protein
VRVDERDAAAESVRLRNDRDRRVTPGGRAASIVLVRAAGILVALLAFAGSASAQTPEGAAPRPEPFQITDNSFLVEEAFNQDPKVVQHIFSAMRAQGSWAGTFTQEWPVPGQTHQLSYTVAFMEGDPHSGFGDTLLNYRYQASMEGPRRPAVSPRVSLILPTGRHADGLGDGSPGLQVNVPVSKQFGDWYVHWNGGLTWLPRAQTDVSDQAATAEDRQNLVSPFLAASAIYRLRQMLNLMLESVASFDQNASAGGPIRETTLTLSPGVRGGWNLGEKQIIIGVAMPISWSHGSHDTGAFLYFSYELPFKK